MSTSFFKLTSHLRCGKFVIAYRSITYFIAYDVDTTCWMIDDDDVLRVLCPLSGTAPLSLCVSFSRERREREVGVTNLVVIMLL